MILFLISGFLQAKSTRAFVEDFKAGNYAEVCRNGLKHYYGGRKDEIFVTMVGTSCAYVDNINPLGMLQKNLIGSAGARETASYFSALVLQKRLLYQFMLDDTKLDYLTLPYSSHILSLIMSHVSSGNYKTLSTSPKMIKIIDGEKTILLSVSDDEKHKILVDVYEKATLVKRHWFQ